MQTQNVKLGKRDPKHDARTLQLAHYVNGSLPSIPAKRQWSDYVKVSWGMMDNDALGDCTSAAFAHQVMLWTAANGSVVIPTDADVISFYSGSTGYDPNNPSTDQGGVELDVLNYAKSTGIAGHKLFAFAAVEVHNHNLVKAAINLFGGVYIGVALPLTAQGQTTWSVVHNTSDANPGSWGGHAVIAIDYDDVGLTVVTWGQLLRMTWAFWNKYIDESYALLSQDWATGSKIAPSGFDLEALKTDLSLI